MKCTGAPCFVRYSMFIISLDHPVYIVSFLFPISFAPCDINLRAHGRPLRHPQHRRPQLLQLISIAYITRVLCSTGGHSLFTVQEREPTTSFRDLPDTDCRIELLVRFLALQLRSGRNHKECNVKTTVCHTVGKGHVNLKSNLLL